MRKAGFSYNHPDDVEPDIRNRLDALTSGGTLHVDQMSPEQQAALKELQDYERRVGHEDFELQEIHSIPSRRRSRRDVCA